MRGAECGGIFATGIIGESGAQPSPGITKGNSYQSISKQGIVGRGTRELNIVQAQVDRKLGMAHALQCVENLELNIICTVKCDRAARKLTNGQHLKRQLFVGVSDMKQLPQWPASNKFRTSASSLISRRMSHSVSRDSPKWRRETRTYLSICCGAWSVG